MRIPDYKKRAAKAAEKWSRLQAKKEFDSEDFSDEIYVNKSTEQRLTELIDDLEVPATAVQGIHIVKKQEVNEELRDIA